MLSNFVDGDTLAATQDKFNHNKKRSVSDIATNGAEAEPAPSDSARSIVQKAKKTIFKGLLGGFEF